MTTKRSREELVRDFVAFHVANPKVYELFKRFAYELIAAGRKRMSAKLIVERIRWETTVSTTLSGFHPVTGDALKINNIYTAYYARLFILHHPGHEDLFELRGRTT